jgi:NAD+ diphosphatase
VTGLFQLAGPPLLSRSTVDRQEPLVDDTEAQAALWPTGRLVEVDQAGCVPTTAGGTRIVFRRTADLADAPTAEVALLGRQDDIGYWAVRVRRETGDDTDRSTWRVWEGSRDTESDAEEWLDLRGAADTLGATDAGLFTTAVAVLNWQRSAKFCARSGDPVTFTRAGWASRCTGCDREEYPRTDPAVICLVHDEDGENGSHVLLARQPTWPPGRYSVLAGFVEAGESLENTVVREMAEEVGAAVRNVRYLGSQPWPFPRSLMLGFTAVADRSAPLHPADGEIAEARWVSRATVRDLLANGGVSDDLALPGGVSIARHMLEAWAESD